MDRDPMGMSPFSSDVDDADLTCQEFLAMVGPSLPDDLWPKRATKQLMNGAHIFCGQCNFNWDGEAQTIEGQCHICFRSDKVTDKEDWRWLLVHELIHCDQFGCGNDKGDGPLIGDPIIMPPPKDRDPRIPQWVDCDACKKWEHHAYEAQCKGLFPNDKKKRKQCYDYGICQSCSHSCSGLSGFEKMCEGVVKPER
jgi:hypothetical protein